MAAALAGTLAGSAAQAAGTFVYDGTGADGKPWELRISTSEFFARIEGGPQQPASYLLFDGSTRLVFYAIDTAQKRYWLLPTPGAGGAQPPATPPPVSAAEPVRAVPAPIARPDFTPSDRQEEVAGLRCRVVQHTVDGKPASEQCMATPASLGVSERDVRTLTRLLNTAQGYGMGWGVLGTRDERLVSIRARDPEGKVTAVLKSVDGRPLAAGAVRVGADYRRVDPPGAAGAGPTAQAATGAETPPGQASEAPREEARAAEPPTAEAKDEGQEEHREEAKVDPQAPPKVP
jgi:hypothetical protein